MLPETAWLAFAIVVVLVGLGAAAAALARRERGAALGRRASMAGLAERLGFRYLGSLDQGALASLPPCSLFKKGDLKAVHNLMADRPSDPQRLVLDFEFGDARGPRAGPAGAPGWGTVYLVAMARLRQATEWPSFRAYLTDWFGGPAGVRGLYRLAFEDDPQFEAGYLIAGEPREGVRRALTPGMRAALGAWAERGPRPVVEALPGWVAVYVESEPGDRAVAQRAERLLAYASGIATSPAGSAPGA